MRYAEILRESRQADLYHTMTVDKAIDVFSKDIMEARWQHNIPGYGLTNGNSFSRNTKLRWNGCIWIVVDQEKLSHQNRIVPLDGEYVFYKSIGSTNNLKDRQQIGNGHLAEEFVVGDIKNIHRVIKAMHLSDNNENFTSVSGSEKLDLYQTVRTYSKKWHIPLIVDPDVLRALRDILRGRRYDREDDLVEDAE